jgi:cysteinyl-tRNA synthetase
MASQLHVYNTLTRKKELFTSIVPGRVGLYVCGPTVYSEPHVGNLRTFCSFDIVYRYLTFLGYEVRYVRNITDAGHLTNDRGEGVNRMEAQAKLESLEPMEIVQKYTVSFHRIMDAFNTIPPTIEPTATGHIVEQIELIENLIKNGFAYEVDGSVYFDVKKYNDTHGYGILSGRNIDELMAGYRDLDGQEEKRNSIDFALWKKAAPEHIMQWNSPWGKGFPGWHLECSAMSTKYLGETFDIHGGGMDLKFPHHECEIAQNVGNCKQGGAKYWLHTNMLNFNGQKMSKSLGNSILPMEFVNGNHPLLDKGYAPSVLRFLFLQSHYSSELDINIKGLQDAEKGLGKLMDAYEVTMSFELLMLNESKTELDVRIESIATSCKESMDDDFNTAKTIGYLFELATIVNSLKGGQIKPDEISANGFQLLKTTLKSYLFDVFGLKNEHAAVANNKLDDTIQVLINLRKEAKAKKDFVTSDAIRNQLQAIGIQIKDEKNGEMSWSLV